MKHNVCIVVLAFFINVSLDLKAQNNPMSDWKTMAQVINAPKGFGVKVTTSIYNTSNNIVVQKSMGFKRKGNNLLMELDEFILLKNSKNLVKVNKIDKTISVTQDTTAVSNSLINMNDIEELKADTNDIVFLGLEDNNKRYRINEETDLYTGTEVFINQQTHFYSKIIYHYKPDNIDNLARTEIVLSNLESNISDKIFNETEFIEIKQGVIKPNAKYRQYEIE